MIVELSGGLGNQMFQYAAARYVQINTGEEMLFNPYPFQKDPQRNYSLGHFALNNQVTMLPRWKAWMYGNWSETLCHVYHRFGMTRGAESFKKLSKKGLLLTFDVYKYYPIELKRGYYWKGNFQSEKYFSGIKETLLNDFSLEVELPKETAEVVNCMQSEEAVCVHIRRGDYVTNPVDHEILDICGENYYIRGMEYILSKVSNPIFYVFSNTSEDLEWIRNNYRLPGEVRYVDLHQPDYLELFTMTNCKHFIISNSTFSWWAQYLGDRNDKIVMAPSTWYNGDAQDATDIYQTDWIIIDNNEDKI